MNFALPDWVPWWVPLVLLLPALLYGLAFLFMPFSVIGLKSRLESIEGRLDEIQADIRMLAARGPEPGPAPSDYDDLYAPPPVAVRPRERDREPTIVRPPIPPPAHTMYEDDPPDDRPPPPPHTRPVRRTEAPPPPRQEPRAEPRLNWPR